MCPQESDGRWVLTENAAYLAKGRVLRRLRRLRRELAGLLD
jgi:hypothetical protein